MIYQFLVETYRTERLKTLTVWSTFRDEDLAVRPHPRDRRGRSVLEHMVHQCLSENLWFSEMLGIDVSAPPLPAEESRLGFIQQYASDSARRLEKLAEKKEEWWEEEVKFFDTRRPRSWVLVRRVTHTAHHRGQQTAMLRMLGRELYSTYGPTADTGGLPHEQGVTIYAYADEEALLKGESSGETKASLPGPSRQSATERP